MTSVRAGIESAESVEVSAVPGSVNTISGMVLYEDREYANYGFTGNTPAKAVRYATIELVDASTSGVLYSSRTDSRGMFNISFSPVPARVYVRALSEAAPAAVSTLSVHHLSGAIYAVPSINVTLNGSADFGIMVPTANPAGGAFNILDVLTNGQAFIEHLSGSPLTIPLQAFWEIGSHAGTFFCTGCPFPGDGIYVLNTSSDTDEFDDDVLYHEFGHYVAANYSRDDSPGGSHALSSNDLDMRLSWSEGWGDFFPAAVKSWLASNVSTRGLLSSAPGMELSRYVDTDSSGEKISFDFANPGASNAYKFSTNETAVAKILLDLQSSYTMQPIWEVVSGFTSSLPSTPVNLETFWDAWYDLRGLNTATAELATVRSIYSGRGIHYDADVYENDDLTASASTYTVGITAPQERTLYSKSYPAADADIVSFLTAAGTTYTITTSNMLNGADTVISLLNGPGGSTNDNMNNMVYTGKVPSDMLPSLCSPAPHEICHENRQDILGSQVRFVAPTSGTYSVRIESSALRPLSAGRYGSYTLTISSQ